MLIKILHILALISTLILNNYSLLFKKSFVKNNNYKKILFFKNIFIDLLELKKKLKNDLLDDVNNINVPFQDNFLFVNDIKNNTIYEINTKKIRHIIINLFNQHTTCFKVVQENYVIQAKKYLNISPKDILININKALILAKKINVNYLIYSSIYKKYKKLYLKIQIILVNSKEIFWDTDILIGSLKI